MHRLSIFVSYNFIILLLILGACGKQLPQTTSKVSLNFGQLSMSSADGGVVVVDQSGGSTTTYVFTSVNSGETLNVASGSHTFHAFTWGGPHPLEGAVTCGSQSVNLQDISDTQNVSISVSASGCTNYTAGGSDSTYGFDQLEIAGCNSLANITGITSLCDFPSDQYGDANSYKVEILGSNGRNLMSDCFGDDGGTNDGVRGNHVAKGVIRIPTGGALGVVPDTSIFAYDSEDCRTVRESISRLSFSSTLEGRQQITDLYHGGTTSRLFWSQNHLVQNTNILSNHMPTFGCVNATGTPEACFTDYDLDVPSDSSRTDLYYQIGASSTSHLFYSNEPSNISIHLTKGTPNAVGVPTACTISASTGYTTAPTCTCGIFDGNLGGTLPGCKLAIFHDNAIDKFTGYPSATPKTVSFTLANASPAPTSASYAYTIYASDNNFEGIAYIMRPYIELMGTNFGQQTYDESHGDANYPYSNRGTIGDILVDLGEDGIAGAMKTLGFTSCTSTGLGSTFTTIFDGTEYTIALTEQSVSETSLPFPFRTPIAYDRKYHLTVSTSTSSEETTWLMKCAATAPAIATSTPDERQIGEVWERNQWASGTYSSLELLAYDHSRYSEKVSQLSSWESSSSSVEHAFYRLERRDSSNINLKSIQVYLESSITSGTRVFGIKDNASACTQVFYADKHEAGSPYVVDSTEPDFTLSLIAPTPVATPKVNAVTYAVCTPIATVGANGGVTRAVLWAQATPVATVTPLAQPSYVAKKVWNSTCSAAGSARSEMECQIYWRMGITPTLVSISEPMMPIEKLFKQQQMNREKQAFNKLKHEWAWDNGACVEISR